MPSIQRPAAIAWSMALQALGSASTFVVAFVIAHSFGLAEQGHFGLMKSWTDVLVTVLMFGLPQGLLHYAYRADADLARLRGLVHRYVLSTAALGIVAALACASLGRLAVAVVVASAPGLVFHGLLRSLMLRLGGQIVYATLTATPSVSLLLGVAALVALGSSQWEWSIAMSAGVSVAVALLAASLTGLPPAGGAASAPSGLWSASLHNFVFNVCVAAQPALLLAFLVGPDANQLGASSLSFYFMQICSVLAGFIAPAVHDRLAASPSLTQAWARDRGRVGRIALTGVGGVVLLVVAMPLVFSGLFRESYAIAIAASQVMVVAGFLSFFTRLMATVQLAIGRFDELSRQALARVALSFGFGWLVQRLFSIPTSVAAAWGVVLSEATVAFWGLWQLGSAVRAAPLGRPSA